MKNQNLSTLATTGIIGLGMVLTCGSSAIAELPSQQISPASSQNITPQRQYQTQGVIFTAPPGFSDIKPLGNQTTGIVFPSAATQTRQLTVRLAELTPANLGMASLDPRELAEYARYSFFGITITPKNHKTRRFLGQEITGDVLMQANNGAATYLEFYVVPMSLQRQLVIAFEADTELPIYMLEKTIQTVADSMREIPPSKKKKKK